MKLIINTDNNTLTQEIENKERVFNLYTKEAFELLSLQWVRVGWSQKYQYTFSWMGRPIIQLPEDVLRIQEVIYRVKPDVIIETGIAHGGSLIYYASLCKTMGKGRIIGIDIEIRPHNRAAIESHELFSYITLIEGSSVESAIVEQVKSLVKPQETVLVILDSNHTKEHVLRELEVYHSLVTPGSYIVATDGIMKDLRGDPKWRIDNPCVAALEFAQRHPEFTVEQPNWSFNESDLTENITHWSGAWLKRK